MREKGISVEEVEASGPKGRITHGDVQKSLRTFARTFIRT